MRKRFFIKPKLQMLHLFWSMSAILISFIAGYLLIENILSTSLSQYGIDPIDWMRIRDQMRLGFSVIFLILSGALGLENYLFFHSVIGPMYSLENAIKRISRGEFNDVIHSRDTDQLREITKEFEDMRINIQNRIAKQDARVRDLLMDLENIIKSPNPDNLDILRSKFNEIRKEIERKAA